MIIRNNAGGGDLFTFTSIVESYDMVVQLLKNFVQVQTMLPSSGPCVSMQVYHNWRAARKLGFIPSPEEMRET